jgi:U3 small nucleolar RNA-associated protein 10
MALLPLAKKDGNVHRTLLNFWSATLVDFVERIRGSRKETNEELVKVLTEGFFKALESAGSDEQMQVCDFQMWKPAAGFNISFLVQSSALPPLLLFIRSLPLAEGPFEALFGVVNLTSSPSERAVMVLLSLLDAAPSGFAAESAVKQLRRLDSASLGDAVISVASRCSLARGLSLLLSAMLVR